MKSTGYFVLFMLSCATFFGQHVTISGTVKNHEQEVVAYANVVFIPLHESEDVYGTLTDEFGTFSIRVPKQSYHLEVSVIGLPPTRLLVELNNTIDQMSLGDILIDTKVSLEEVMLTAEKAPYQIALDKKVYEVSKDLTVTGGSLMDVMQNIPSVQVDVDGQMTMRGNAKVRILLDGRISGLTDSNTLLRTIPAASIDKVEVITNPSSKYSAEGSGGIINIVLKKGKKKQMSASVEGFSGIRINSGLNINITKAEKMHSWYINAGTGYSEPKATGSLTLNRMDSLSSRSFQTSEKILQQGYLLSNVGGTYAFNARHSVSTDLTFRYADLSTLTTLKYSDFNHSILSESSQRRDRESFQNHFVQFTGEYNITLNENGSSLKLSALSQTSAEEGASSILDEIIIPSPSLRAKDVVANAIKDQRFTLALDYVHNLANHARLEFGGRSRFTAIENDYRVERLVDTVAVSIPQFTDATDYHEHITAFYAQYAKSYDKLKFQVGVRTESTAIKIFSQARLNPIPLNYTDLFPSAYLDYRWDEDQGVRFAVSRRIQRPRRNALIPFSSFSDGRNIFVGNPEVDPAYVILAELSYESAWSNTLSIAPSLFYRHTAQAMDFYIEQDIVNIQDIPTEVFVTKTVNIGTDKTLGLELGFRYKPLFWLSFYNELVFSYYRQKGSYERTRFDAEGFALSGRIHADMKLSNSLTIQFQNRFRGADRRGQLSRKSLYRLDVGMSKRLFNNKASLTLNVKDIFDSWEWDISTRADNFSQNIRSQVRVPQLNISFRYRWNQKRYQGKKGQQYDRL